MFIEFQIRPCFNNLGCPAPTGGCDWVPWWKCEEAFGVCVPSKAKSVNGKPSKCHWRRSPAYLGCLQDP